MKTQILKTFIGGLILIAAATSGCAKDNNSGGGGESSNGCPSGQVKNYAGVCVPDTGVNGNGQTASWQQEVYITNTSVFKEFLQDINFCYKKGCKGIDTLILHIDMKTGTLPSPARIAMSFDNYWWQYVVSAKAYPLQEGFELRPAGTPYPNNYSQYMYAPQQASVSIVALPLDASANTLEVILSYEGSIFASGYIYRIGVNANGTNNYGTASLKTGGPGVNSVSGLNGRLPGARL